MSVLVFEAIAVPCDCELRHEDDTFHGFHPVIVMAGEPIWVGKEGGRGYDRHDAEEVAEERLRSRLGLLLADSLAVKGVDT